MAAAAASPCTSLFAQQPELFHQGQLNTARERGLPFLPFVESVSKPDGTYWQIRLISTGDSRPVSGLSPFPGCLERDEVGLEETHQSSQYSELTVEMGNDDFTAIRPSVTALMQSHTCQPIVSNERCSGCVEQIGDCLAVAAKVLEVLNKRPTPLPKTPVSLWLTRIQACSSRYGIRVRGASAIPHGENSPGTGRASLVSPSCIVSPPTIVSPPIVSPPPLAGSGVVSQESAVLPPHLSGEEHRLMRVSSWENGVRRPAPQHVFKVAMSPHDTSSC